MTAAATARLGERDVGTILFLDEVHRFNKAQQDALLPSVESGLLVLVGATTENPYFEVNPPLLSRSTLFRLEPLDVEATHRLLCRGLGAEEATATDEALDLLVDRAAGDGRLALTSLEVAVAIAAGHEDPTVTFEDAEAALGTKAVRYGRDEHYDVISAFIKSIRGSDPDAGLYWLARMLEAGEEARFIARRLVILASEDIGMADPMALVVADAAARAVEFVGLPEARLNLAQAVVHLATAPKSNRVYRALAAAAVDARAPGTGLVPPHLRDAHYKGAAGLGHGDGYDYPHDDPRGWVEQAHRPEEVEGNVYYEPSPHGHEAEVAAASPNGPIRRRPHEHRMGRPHRGRGVPRAPARGRGATGPHAQGPARCGGRTAPRGGPADSRHAPDGRTDGRRPRPCRGPPRYRRGPARVGGQDRSHHRKCRNPHLVAAHAPGRAPLRPQAAQAGFLTRARKGPPVG